MNITPLIPDGYNGPIKQLTCRICKHVFYLTQDDHHRLQEVRFCHECSLILLEELQKNQGANALTPPMVAREKSAVSPPTRSPMQPTLPMMNSCALILFRRKPGLAKAGSSFM